MKDSIIKRLGDYRAALKDCVGENFVSLFHHVRPKNLGIYAPRDFDKPDADTYDYETKGVKCDVVELYRLTGNRSIGFGYLIHEDVNKSKVIVSLKDIQNEKFLLSKVFKYEEVKPFFKEFNTLLFDIKQKNIDSGKYLKDNNVDKIFNTTFGMFEEKNNDKIEVMFPTREKKVEFLNNHKDFDTLGQKIFASTTNQTTILSNTPKNQILIINSGEFCHYFDKKIINEQVFDYEISK